MDIDVLREFVEVAEQQSFSNAAKKLYLSQPTLSKHVAALEAELGSSLIQRTRSNVSLTPAGEIFLGGAKRILSDLDSTVSKIDMLNRGIGGRIVVALQTDIDAHLKIYSKAIQVAKSRFKRLYPDSVVTIRQQEEDYVGHLTRGEWDACFVIDTRDAKAGEREVEPGLRYEWICDLAPAVLVGEGHRLADRAKVSWSDLDGEVYHAVRTDSVMNYLPTIESFMKRNGVRCVFSGNTSVGMYEEGMLLFAHQFSEIAGLVSIDLDEPQLLFSIYVACSASSENALLEDFVSCARMAAKGCVGSAGA